MNVSSTYLQVIKNLALFWQIRQIDQYRSSIDYYGWELPENWIWWIFTSVVPESDRDFVSFHLIAVKDAEVPITNTMQLGLGNSLFPGKGHRGTRSALICAPEKKLERVKNLSARTSRILLPISRELACHSTSVEKLSILPFSIRLWWDLAYGLFLIGVNLHYAPLQYKQTLVWRAHVNYIGSLMWFVSACDLLTVRQSMNTPKDPKKMISCTMGLPRPWDCSVAQFLKKVQYPCTWSKLLAAAQIIPWSSTAKAFKIPCLWAPNRAGPIPLAFRTTVNATVCRCCKGDENQVPDALSRLPKPSPGPALEDTEVQTQWPRTMTLANSWSQPHHSVWEGLEVGNGVLVKGGWLVLSVGLQPVISSWDGSFSHLGTSQPSLGRLYPNSVPSVSREGKFVFQQCPRLEISKESHLYLVLQMS